MRKFTFSKNLSRQFIFITALLLLKQVVYAQPVPGVNVNGHPVAQGDTVYVCKNNSVIYTSTASNYTSIIWQFHLGTPATSAIPVPPPIVYNSVGIDSTIQLTSDGTNTSFFYVIIKVTDVHPVIDFTNNNNVCSGTAQQFNSTASGTAPFSYAWSFGNGVTSTIGSPVTTFTSLGCGTATFNNTLIVTDATGCSSTITHPITILQAPEVELQDPDPNSPFSNCENSPTPGNPNFTITLNNISPSAGCITLYSVDFGDGISVSPASFPLTHTYTQIGAFNLVVTALNSNGCTSSKTYIVANQTNPAGSLGTLGTTTNLCAPATVPFTISNWQINSIGTLYILNFGDGTTLTLTHPLNPGNTTDTIYHTYTTSSCPAGTYNATLNVTNACGATPYTAGGIRVLKKATSAFTVAATSYCVGQNVCFNNTTTPGAGINCTTSSTTTWDFGDGAAPVAGVLSPCHIYTSPGIYTVTLTTTTYCGPSVYSLQICITTPPVPGFTIDNTSGCTPVAVTATNTTVSLNNCTIATYFWNVVYTAGFCGTSPSWAFTNGTTATTANPSFLFTNPGTYTIILAVTNPCGTFTTTRTIIVKKPPVVTMTPVANFCGPLTITPVATVTACGPNTPTYLWTFSGAVPASSTNSNPGPVTFTGAGLHTISLAVTNECGTTNASQQFIIDTVTDANAGPPQNLCGSTVTMAANTVVIGTGVWSYVSGPAGYTITTPSSPTTTITNLVPGTYVFKWTITNGTCISSSNVTITIAAGPTPAAAGPDQNLCLATSTTLAANTVIIGTGTWTYISGPPGYTITDPSSPTTTVTGLMPGVYIFRWTTSFSTCSPSTDDVQITVYDNPAVADAGTDQTICSPSVAMAGNIPASGNGTWTTVSGPNTPVITTASSPTTTITGLIAGTYIFKWRITNGACPPSEDNVQVIVTALATTAAAGPDQIVCAATSITLAGNNALVGTGVWSYISGPTGYIITDPNLPNTTVTGLIPGTYIFQWTITNGVCPPTTDQVQVTINDNVTVADAGANQNLCGNTVTMAANTAVIGTGVWSYVSGPAGSVITTPSSPTTAITGLVTGTYVFRWTITNGSCVSISNVTIIIVAGPTAAAAGPDQNLCLNTSTALAANSPVIGTGVWTYQSGPAGYTITNSLSPSTTVTGLVPGVYIFRWTTSFSNCTPSTDDVQITVYDNPTIADAGTDQIICSPTVTMGGNTPAIGNGTWTTISGPNTPLITTATSPLTTITGLIPGTYIFKWRIINGVCPPSEDNVQVVVTAAATISAAGADQTVCDVSNVTLGGNTALVGTGVWSYVSGPAGYNITTPSSSTTTVTGLVPGTYIFQWTITNGVCPPSTDQVQINNLNDLQNTISAPVTTICSGQSITIIGAIPTGGTGTYTYTWEQSIDGGTTWAPASATGTNQNYTATLTSSICFRRKVSSLPCEKYSNVICITVQAAVTNNTIAANQSICINTAAATINGSNPTGGNTVYTYQWQNFNGTTWIDIPGANNIDYTPPGLFTVTTLYRRIVSTTLCSGPQANISNVVTITVNQDSKALFTGNPTLHCAPFNLSTAITVTPFPDRNGLYQWFVIIGTTTTSLGSNATGVFPGYTLVPNGTSVTIKLRTTSQYGCKPDSMEIIFTTITTAVANFTKTPANGCGPLTVSFTNTSNIINTPVQYFWNFGNGTFQNVPNPLSVTYSNNPNFIDTTYYITLKAFNGCDTTYKRDSVKVFPNSKARFGVDTTRGCSPFTIHITNTSPGNNFNYYWDFGDGVKDTTHILGSFTHTYNTGAITNYTIALISENQCSRDTQTITIVVSPNIIQPFVAANGNQLSGCAPHTVTFNNSSVGAAQLTWNFGDGTPVITTPNNQNTINHLYNNAGNYTVTIHLLNDCSDTIIYRNVTVYAPPIAGFSASPLKICTSQFVTVVNTSTNANSFEWFWGDATTSTFTQGQHSYSNIGSYTITLVAKRVNPSGFICTDTTRNQITVVDKIPAQINVDPGKRCAPYTLNVNAGNISGYDLVEWVIFDSSTAQGQFHLTGLTASHIYNVPGTYSVKLIVHTTTGCADSITYTFQVFNTPKTTFSPTPVITCSHDTTITFTAVTISIGNNPVTYKWFINGSIQGITNPFSYHFSAPLSNTQPKEFIVQALAENAAGCGDTSLQGKVIIQPLPLVYIQVDPSVILYQPNYTFTFKDTFALNPNKTYVWDMGENTPTTRNGREITYEYGNTGTYKVSLYVTDFSTGCKAKDSVRVTILYVPGTLFVPNAFYPNSRVNELKTFLPTGIGLEKYHLQIFDAWGKMVFETTELNPDGSPKVAWDGSFNGSTYQNNGKPLSQDAFVWKIVEAKFKNGKDWEGMSYNGGPPRRFGTLTLFR